MIKPCVLSCGKFQLEIPEALPYNSPDDETISFPSLSVPCVKNDEIAKTDAENCPNVPIGKNVTGSTASAS